MTEDDVLDFRLTSINEKLDGMQTQINTISTSDRKQQDHINTLKNEVTNLIETNKRLQAQIDKTDANISKVGWLVISTVIIAILGLVVGPQILS